MNGQIVTEYEPGELMYAVRNPTTNIRNNGYGVAELEQLVSVVTNIFNAMTHNSQFFQNGAAVKGIINIKTGKDQAGTMGDQLEAFKRAWRAMVLGTANAWSTPILQTDGVEFVNMGNTNREMEFHLYLDFLVKISCAVYSIDPGEINFFMSAGGASGAHPLFESNQEAKLKMSKDKGLRPLLASVARWINQYILPSVSDEHKFTWVGIDSKDEKEVIELRAKEGGAYATIDEIRAEAGRTPLGAEKGGDLILNPHYITWLQQQSMAASMNQQWGDEGEAPGDEGEAPGDEGEAPPEEEGVEEGALNRQGDEMDEEAGEDEEASPALKKSLLEAERKYLRIMLAG